MPVFATEVYVEADSQEEAHRVLTERIGHDADYGFIYRIWFWNDTRLLPGVVSDQSPEIKPDYVREVSHDTPISLDIVEAGKYKEVAIGDCDHGCKIYEHSITGERVLAHNSTYGCRL